MAKYNMQSKLALKRLQIGITAIEESSAKPDQGSGFLIIEVTQSFITARDALELQMSDVDKVQPLIQDIVATLGKVPAIPVTYSGTQKMKDWLAEFSRMRASDCLNEEQVRQLCLDLDNAYHEFKQLMQ